MSPLPHPYCPFRPHPPLSLLAAVCPRPLLPLAPIPLSRRVRRLLLRHHPVICRRCSSRSLTRMSRVCRSSTNQHCTVQGEEKYESTRARRWEMPVERCTCALSNSAGLSRPRGALPERLRGSIIACPCRVERSKDAKCDSAAASVHNIWAATAFDDMTPTLLLSPL